MGGLGFIHLIETILAQIIFYYKTTWDHNNNAADTNFYKWF